MTQPGQADPVASAGRRAFIAMLTWKFTRIEQGALSTTQSAISEIDSIEQVEKYLLNAHGYSLGDRDEIEIYKKMMGVKDITYIADLADMILYPRLARYGLKVTTGIVEHDYADINFTVLVFARRQ